MYKNLLLSNVFSSILIIALVPLITLILQFIFKVKIFSADDESHKILANVLLLGGLWILCWWYVFFVKLNSISIQADSNNSPQSFQIVKDSLLELFQTPESQGKKIFDVNQNGNLIEVSWNKEVITNQILAFGKKDIQYKVSFMLNEKDRRVDTYTSILHTNQSVGVFANILHFVYQTNWSGGIQYETGGMITPSFEIKNGKIVIDIQKIKFGNGAMIDSAIELLKKDGWSMRFLMFKHSIAQWFYTFTGIILLMIGLLLILGSIFIK